MLEQWHETVQWWEARMTYGIMCRFSLSTSLAQHPSTRSKGLKCRLLYQAKAWSAVVQISNLISKIFIYNFDSYYLLISTSKFTVANVLPYYFLFLQSDPTLFWVWIQRAILTNLLSLQGHCLWNGEKTWAGACVVTNKAMIANSWCKFPKSNHCKNKIFYTNDKYVAITWWVTLTS